MTGNSWELVIDPAKRIKGVRSKREQAPFRQDSFPKPLKNFEAKSSYREWSFVFKPPKRKTMVRQASGTTTLKSAEQ